MQLPLRRPAGVQKKKPQIFIHILKQGRSLKIIARNHGRKHIRLFFFFSFYDPIKSDIHSLDLILPLLPKTKPLALYRTVIVLYS